MPGEKPELSRIGTARRLGGGSDSFHVAAGTKIAVRLTGVHCRNFPRISKRCYFKHLQELHGVCGASTICHSHATGVNFCQCFVILTAKLS